MHIKIALIYCVCLCGAHYTITKVYVMSNVYGLYIKVRALILCGSIIHAILVLCLSCTLKLRMCSVYGLHILCMRVVFVCMYVNRLGHNICRVFIICAQLCDILTDYFTIVLTL